MAVEQLTEDEWLALLAAADYTIMVLNATALLSQQERWFLSELLHGHYGLQRVALVINQMDLIPEEERASISDLVRAFLGPLHNQPAMVEFSAARARAGLASGEMPADCGFEELSYLVAGDLIASTLALRTTAAVRGAGLILAALSEAVARQQALLSLDQEHLQERLSLLDVNSQRMQALIARAQSRLTLFVATLLKEQMLREIEAFGRTLKEQLPAEIMAIEDIARIKRHLPGYLEKLWMAFFDRQLPMARARLAEEVQHIHEIIAEDLQEILGVDTPSLTPLLAEFDPRPARALAVLAPKRGKQAAPLAASVLQTGGLVIWLTGGGLLGIAALGIGQIVRMVSKKSVAESNRQALIASAIESLPELERRIQDQVEAGYTQLVEELQGAVTELYAGRIAEMRTLLEKSAQQRQTLDARRDQLESLVRVTVPELRELLSHLSPEEVGV